MWFNVISMSVNMGKLSTLRACPYGKLFWEVLPNLRWSKNNVYGNLKTIVASWKLDAFVYDETITNMDWETARKFLVWPSPFVISEAGRKEGNEDKGCKVIETKYKLRQCQSANMGYSINMSHHFDWNVGCRSYGLETRWGWTSAWDDRVGTINTVALISNPNSNA